MKKLFSLLLGTFIVAACNTTHTATSYNLDNQKSPLKINSALHSEVTFTMQTNPSTGYSWYTNLEGLSSAIQVVTDSISQTNVPAGMVGVPLEKIYTLKFLQKGEYTLEFNYLRPWETNVLPVKQKTVVVTVL
jgi:predicted secreted protein